MRSSYAKNNYEAIFENVIKIFLPHKCVELGVLDGYSTLHIAKGAMEAFVKSNHPMHLNAYDLWEDYPYKHGSMADVEYMLQRHKVNELVTLHKRDAFTVHDDYAKNSVCFLHVDLSNDGEVLRKIVERWDDKLSFGGMMMFEGGSVERDNVDWMIKYGKESIRDEINTNITLNKKYLFATHYPFPSLSVFIKHS